MSAVVLWRQLGDQQLTMFGGMLVADRPAMYLVLLFAAWNLVQFGDWALKRTYENYEASLALGRALPPDTLVQGKLAPVGQGLFVAVGIAQSMLGEHVIAKSQTRLGQGEVHVGVARGAPGVPLVGIDSVGPSQRQLSGSQQ